MLFYKWKWGHWKEALCRCHAKAEPSLWPCPLERIPVGNHSLTVPGWEPGSGAHTWACKTDPRLRIWCFSIILLLLAFSLNLPLSPKGSSKQWNDEKHLQGNINVGNLPRISALGESRRVNNLTQRLMNHSEIISVTRELKSLSNTELYTEWKCSFQQFINTFFLYAWHIFPKWEIEDGIWCQSE